MKSIEEFKKDCVFIEEEIWKSYIDNNGKAEPIVDGIVDLEKYFMSEPKILWILKEPHDDKEDGYATGGGWHFSKDFLAKNDFYERMKHSRSTWHPIIYVSYGILNDFIDWNDMNYIRDDLTMVEVIKQIAVINIKKLPGFTRTYDFKLIKNSYIKHKQLLLKQIELYEPDIIIGGGGTIDLFYNDLGIKQENIKKDNSIKYSIKDNKLFISAYHPAQTKIKRDIYVNDIIHRAKNFWTSRKQKITVTNNSNGNM